MLAAPEDFKFLQNTPQLRERLQEALREGYVALGLLGWEIAEGRIQAHKMFFRWHEDAELFDTPEGGCRLDLAPGFSEEPRRPPGERGGLMDPCPSQAPTY